jgi:integrase
MAAVAWNDRSIKALKSAKSRYIAWSKAENGLGVRVAASGRKSFVYMYRFDGKARMMTLGRYQAVGDLATCNKTHAEAVKKLEKGQDPGAILVQEKKEHRESDTFAELATMYLVVKRKGKKGKPVRERTWKEAERILCVYVYPKIGKKKARDVTRADIGKLLKPLVLEGKIHQANRMLTWTRGVLRFGLNLGLLDSDPTVGLKGGDETERTRVLTEDEIRALWALADIRFNKDRARDVARQSIRLALRLLLVTGQRGLDVVETRWSEIDDDWWVIPAARYKTRHDQRVALTPTAMKVLADAKALYPKSEYVFDTAKGKPLGEGAMAKAVRKYADVLQLGGEGDTWVPKDVRRTVATILGDLNFDGIQIDRLVMGHVPDKIARTYNRATYDNDRRELSDAWEADLQRILRTEPRPDPDVLPDNVTRMRA